MLDLQATEQTPSATEQSNGTERYIFITLLLCGCRAVKSRTGKLIMTTLAIAMRAARVADFYMTKDLSKDQEALGPVLQPFIVSMRRVSTEESAREAAKSALVQRARQRMRLLSFCANHTMWFSACEVGVFLTTSDSCVKQNQRPRYSLAKALQCCKSTSGYSTITLLEKNSCSPIAAHDKQPRHLWTHSLCHSPQMPTPLQTTMLQSALTPTTHQTKSAMLQNTHRPAISQNHPQSSDEHDPRL